MNKDAIWTALHQIMDPEIPAVSLIDMGIIRDVESDDDTITVTMTPTFSGCPALLEMQTLIRERLAEIGYVQVEVQTQFNPPWTSDWITEDGRRKLKEFGLTPPRIHQGNVEIILYDQANCPYCDSTRTTLKNNFGSTLCRAIYYCNACQQPFEGFKAL